MPCAFDEKDHALKETRRNHTSTPQQHVTLSRGIKLSVKINIPSHSFLRDTFSDSSPGLSPPAGCYCCYLYLAFNMLFVIT